MVTWDVNYIAATALRWLMLDHAVPPPEPQASPALDAPGPTLVQRVVAATDDLLRRICRAATQLLDETLDTAERHDAETAADELAQWLGSMGLVAEAGLTRQVQEALRSGGPGPGRALRIASLVDDIRSSVKLTMERPRSEADQHQHVLAIGDESLAADAAIWVLASSFRCTALTPQSPPSTFPDSCDSVVVLSTRTPERVVLEALRERYPSAVCILRADRTELDADVLAWAETVLAPGAGPDELLSEVRLQLTVRDAPIRVAVAGQESTGAARSLRGRGADVRPIRSVEDLETFAAGDAAVEAVVVGADVAHERVEALARRVRTDPRLRDIVVVHQTKETEETTERASDLTARRAVDVVLRDDVSRHEVAHLVEHLVRRVRRATPLAAHRGVGTAPGTTRIILERLLVAAHRDGRTVSVATVRVDDTLDVATLVAELAAEFRSDDVVGRWDDDHVVVALRGLTRRVAVERIRSALRRYEAPHRPIEAAVAEFPYDARESADLVAVATAALERSREADGPAVVAAEWRSEAEAAPDVMVVDPDLTLSSMLASHLSDKGLAVVAIETGGEAADWLIHERRPAPRVLLLEFNTPGLDGLQLLRQLRRAGLLAHIRVLMLSATVRDDDLLVAFELGARDVITKPFSMAVFDNRLNRVLDS